MTDDKIIEIVRVVAENQSHRLKGITLEELSDRAIKLVKPQINDEARIDAIKQAFWDAIDFRDEYKQVLAH